MLFPIDKGQYVDVLPSTTNSEQLTGSKNHNNLSTITALRNTMLIGLTVVPGLANAASANQTQELIKHITHTVGDALTPRVNTDLPIFYIERGVMCCDLRDYHAEEINFVNSAHTNDLAVTVFGGTQPMQGVEYGHLTRLVRRNAKRQSSIPGML